MTDTAKRLCPICNEQPPQPDFHPFCSRRCKTIDLNRWLDGAYRLPGAEPLDPGEGLAEPPPGKPH